MPSIFLPRNRTAVTPTFLRYFPVCVRSVPFTSESTFTGYVRRSPRRTGSPFRSSSTSRSSPMCDTSTSRSTFGRNSAAYFIAIACGSGNSSPSKLDAFARRMPRAFVVGHHADRKPMRMPSLSRTT